MRLLIVGATAVISVMTVVAVPLVSAAVQGLTLSPGDSLNVACSSTVTVQSADAQHAAVNCAAVPVAPPPTPTPNPIGGGTIDGVPMCSDTNQTQWHNPVQRNADGSIKCAYGYELGDNPHQLDQTFGPMGAWWNDGKEQDISYPWETMNENEQKHTAYKIIVRGTDSQPLQPWYTIGGKNYIKAMRGEYHLDGPKGFVMSEYHSFAFEAEICSADGNCGIARFGGVQDLGERLLTHDDNTFTCVDPNPNIPTNMGMCGSSHQFVGPRSMAGGPNDSRRDETWYSSNNQEHSKGFTPAIDLDFGVILGSVWSPIDASNPMNAMSTTPGTRADYKPHYSQMPLIPQNVDDWHHGTSVEVSALNMSIGSFPAKNGRVTAKGYTDRYGNVVQGCTTMGPDCVPFELTNVPVGLEGFRDQEYSQATGSKSLIVNHEVINPKTGNSLIVWPN